MTHPSSEQRLPHSFREAVEDLLPIVKKLATGRYAVSVGGSVGKGTSDDRSDIDLRLFYDAPAEKVQYDETMQNVSARIDWWRHRGVEIDGCWVRRIDEIEAGLSNWIAGTATAPPIIWTLWGYHLPTDIYNQYVIEDPDGVLGHWKAMLTPYPAALKDSLITRHCRSLRYWISDYHYEHKVHRGDGVFLASIASRLVHDMLQILYAVAEIYYPGDGKNLELLPDSTRLPRDFRNRIHQALYPGAGVDAFTRQRTALVDLATEVLEIAESGESLG